MRNATAKYEMMLLRLCLVAGMVVLMAGIGWGQAASATWPLATNTNGSTSGNLTGTGFARGSGLADGGNTTSGGVSWYYSRAYNQSNLTNAIGNNDYLQFAVSPTSGNNFTITSISFGRAVSNSNGTLNISVQFSVDPNFSTYSTIGSTSFNNTTITTTTYSGLNYTVNNAQTLYMRIYGWGLGTSYYFRTNNVVISGTTCALPSQPSTISGNTSPCQGSSQTYSVTNVSGVTYSWVLPPDWTGNSTTNSINVTVGSGSGTISVTPTNACGGGTARTLGVTVNPLSPSPTSITGTSPICAGNSTTLTVQGGLIAYYPFSSDVNDQSGSGLNLSGTGATFTDGGINFNGNLYQSASTSILNTDKHTISFYIKFLSAPASWEKIFGFEPSGSDRSPGIWTTYNTAGIHWRYQLNGTVCCGDEGSNTGVDYSTGFAYNTWYHILGIKNGPNFKFYIDGTLVQDITVADPKTTGVSALKFGTSNTVVVKEFKIYNSDLRWYTGSCGETYVGSGPSITVTPSASITYYVRAEGICNTTACVGKLVTVNELALIYDPSNVSCFGGNNGSIELTVTGGSAPYYYRYSIDGGDNWIGGDTEGWIQFTSGNTQVIQYLVADEYTINVKDENGCVQTECEEETP